MERFNTRIRRKTITIGACLWKTAALASGLALALAGTFLCGEPNESGWHPVEGNPATVPSPPEPLREFRAVWVATVYNLDWPSKPGLPVETQQAELLEILDNAARLHLNAVVLQVRTMCDALYASPIEPWSYYLTGELGKAPEPFWDPLAFAVEEAHRRGLELHAWFNPFRATTGEYGPTLPEDHISQAYPWLVRPSGRHLWLDPSSDFVRNRVITVIFDVVNRYDIDAVHMDDYFYPYPVGNAEPGFADDENWNRYRLGEGLAAPGGPLDRNEWRREMVNGLIRDLYTEVKRAKPWVKLGISPFGIWRSGYPETVKGMDAYSQIFADSRKWLREGWVDYFAPQLYWKTEGRQGFTDLFHWWQDENIHGRHLWPGIATSRIGRGGEADGRGVNEIFGQIEATRAYPGKSTGSGQVHWHWEAFITNRGGVRKLITTETYRDRAVPPPSPWLAKLDPNDKPLPRADALTLTEEPIVDETTGKETDQSQWLIDWKPADGSVSSVRWWLVQTGTPPKPASKSKGKAKTDSAPPWSWTNSPLVPSGRTSLTLESLDGVAAISLRAVDRYGNLGPSRIWSSAKETASSD